MRKYLLFILSFCGLNVAQGQTGSTCYYWFDSDYADRQAIVLQDGSCNSEIDVSALTDAVHTIHFQVTGAEGTQSPVASHLFVKYPPVVALPSYNSDGTCYYWFDSEYASGNQMSLGSGASMLDVSYLTAGVHTVHFQSNGTAQTPVASHLFVIMPEKETANERITSYDYWINSSGTPTAVVLQEPVTSLSLINLLPVPTQSFRSCCFQFVIEESQPVIYAKNDIRIRFYLSETNFTDITGQYVDNTVRQIVTGIKHIAPGRQTERKPAANSIIWYDLTAEAGDILQFKLDKAATIQLFSPSGNEVYAASGAAAIKWGGINAEETGTYYVALHDVTAKSGSTVSMDYDHIDRYAVLSQDIVAVGNGGPSTITFKGNGFDALTSVDLVYGSTVIPSVAISTESKAVTSVKFNFNEAELGQYKAVFHFTDDDVEVEDCMTVEDAVPVTISTTVAYAKKFLLSRGNQYTFKLKNHGNMTAYDVPMQLVIYTTDADNLDRVTIDGQELTAYEESVDSTALEDYLNKRSPLKKQLASNRRSAQTSYPYKRSYSLREAVAAAGADYWKNVAASESHSVAGSPIRRNSPMRRDLQLNVKTRRTSRIYVYLNDVGGPSDPVTSFDPNDIYGYQDADGDKTIRDGLVDVWYTIEFENDPQFATASAHDIYITDQLSPALFDLTTFAPTRIKIGNKEAELTGGTNGMVTINMQPEIYAVAQVEWALDEQTGTVNWHISSLDPMTMEPTEDMSQGVLPVNTDGNGLGEIAFDIQLKPNLPNGTQITNQAIIVFDENEPIETPTWTNIIERILKGDVNGDGMLNLTDASWIVRHYVGCTPEGFNVKIADVNEDGSINLSDAQKVVRIFVGKE